MKETGVDRSNIIMKTANYGEKMPLSPQRNICLWAIYLGSYSYMPVSRNHIGSFAGIRGPWKSLPTKTVLKKHVLLDHKTLKGMTKRAWVKGKRLDATVMPAVVKSC